jgi:hypothetical protein
LVAYLATENAAEHFDLEPEAFGGVLGDELATWVGTLRRNSLRIRPDLSPPGSGSMEPPAAQQVLNQQIVVENPALAQPTAELWQSLLRWAFTSEANLEELRRNPEETVRRNNPDAADAAVRLIVDRLPRSPKE